MIARNPDRKPKKLWSDAGAGEQISGYVAENEHDEAAWVSQQIDESDHPASDVAVFYRTNAQSRVFEEVFIRAGMPYIVVGGVRFYERREVRDVLAYLRVIANQDDVVSLRRILNTPRRGIGDSTVEAIDLFARREQLSFAAALEIADEPSASVRGRYARSPIPRPDDLAPRRCRRAGRNAGEVIEAVLDRTGYLRELELADRTKEESRVDNLRELVSVAREFEERQAELGDPPTLDGFLERVSLVADADSVPDANGGVVTLMTLHTAKGLEFPLVFVTGLEESVFPHARALYDPAEQAEERRLAYVGITRARERLYLSRALSRSAWGRSAVERPVAVPRRDPRRTR